MTTERRRLTRWRWLLCVAAIAALLVACNDDGRTLRAPGPSQTATISTPSTVATAEGIIAAPSLSGAPTTSSATARSLSVSAPWPRGGPIAAKHTCDAADVPPALEWSPGPAGTVEIGLSVVDEDARSTHWVVAGLDARSTGIPEGSVPLSATQALNSAGKVGWSGPCGQPGTTHTYTVTVWYLGQQTELGDGARADDLMALLEGSAIDTAETTGTYTRSTAATQR